MATSMDYLAFLVMVQGEEIVRIALLHETERKLKKDLFVEPSTTYIKNL